MLLFSQQPRPQKELLSRPEKFRRQIRKSSLKERFQTIRQSLMQDLRSDRLHEMLRQNEDGFGEEELRESLQLFEGDYGTSEFTDRMAGSKLEKVLADTLLKNEGRISIREASQVVSVLSNLTYFSKSAVDSLVGKDDFIDHLRRRMERLQMDQVEELRFFIHAMTLLLNLTCEAGPDFNFFCAESDLSLVINRQLAKTIVPARDSRNEYYREIVTEGRDFALRVFKNIVQGLRGKGAQQAGEVAAKLVGSVLCDQENIEGFPARTFHLLAEGLDGNRRFWPALMAHPDHINFIAQICHAIDGLQERCFQPSFLQDPSNSLTSFERQTFYGMVCFMNQLYSQKQLNVLSFEMLVENVLNGYMLAQFILEAQQDNREHFSAGIQLVRLVSTMADVTPEQLIVVREADDPLALLRVIMNAELLKEPQGGWQCMRILQVLLKRNPSFLGKLMELQVIEKLLGVFDSCCHCSESKELHIEAIELATELMRAAKAMDEEGRIFGLMEQRGIVADLKQMTNHQDRAIYLKAEQFMDQVAEVKTTH